MVHRSSAALAVWRGRAAALLVVLAGCAPDPAAYSPSAELIDLLPVAEVRREVRVIDLGTAAARRHLLRGWSGDEGHGGESSVWSDGAESEVRFFLTAARDLPLRLRCAPFAFPGAPEQTVEVLANGERAGRLRMTRGSADYRLVLPEGALAAGENRLALRYGWTRSPREVSGGAIADDRRLGVRCSELKLGGEEASGVVRVRGEQLVIPLGARVDFYIRVPAGGAVLMDGVAMRGAASGELEVAVEPADGRRQAVRVALGHGRVAVPLRRGEGDAARLSLAAVPAKRGNGRAGVRAPAEEQANALGELVLTRPSLGVRRAQTARSREAAAAPAARAVPAASRHRRPNLIIYLVDTLRVDRLGCYGYDKPITPHFDALARRGILFERAVAQSPWTRPSVASLLTGVWPRTHGVNGRHDALAAAAVTLPELLQAAGYRTFGAITNGNVARPFGFGQGFDRYAKLPRGHQRSADVTVAAFEWLDANAGAAPFFLYLHTADPHASYDPPAAFRARFAPGVPRDGTGTRRFMRRLMHREVPVTPAVLENLRALYDAEVAANDASFGALVAGLERRGLWEETAVVVVSDHGEEFFEHGGWDHGKSLYTEVLDIPLLMRLPGLPEGERVASLAQHTDVLPTLLAYAGVPVPEHVEGRNLLPLLTGDPQAAESAEAATVFSYLDLDGIRGAAATGGRWRYSDLRVPRRVELFDRGADPAEKRNRLAARPIDAGFLRAQLKARELLRRGVLAPDRAVLDDELRRELRALGYLQ